MNETRKKEYLENASYSWTEDSIRYLNTPTRSARLTFFYVQEVGVFRTYPPYFTERKNLNSFLIIYTLAGKGRLRYLGKEYHLSPGTVMFLDCMNHHYYECLQNQEWSMLWLHFNGMSARGYYEEFIKNNFHILDSLDPFFMESKLRRILALTMRQDQQSEIIVSGLIVEILTQLLIENESENLGIGFMPEYIKKTAKMMDQHFRESLSLEELADAAGVSKYHFLREFKKYMGRTPNEYMIVARLNHAKELLKYSYETVETIAFECGFHNVSYFINQFKKHELMTPLKYRESWR